MAQPQMLQIKLSRFDAQPWGFRLQGGVDFAAPLLVQKVNGGSLAEQAGLMAGDAVIKINDVDVYNLRHKDAQDVVVRSGNNFVVTVQRGGSTWRPHVTPTGHLPQPNSPYLQTVTKTSLAHKQQESQHIGCGYNNAAKPFGNGVDGNVKSIVNKQYNSPVGIYSDESIAETLSAQAEVLAGGVLGVNFKKNEKEYQAEKSEVLKFLREEESGPSTPAFNHHPYQEPQHHQQQHQHQHQYQQNQYHHQQQQSATRHVTAPVTQPKPPSTGGLPTGQNICAECERLITGVFVRIKDRNLHVECFKCATCGTSLKNQGYYNFNNKLYCDIHAKLAALQNPPSGTEGYVPVPIKPNTKLSASTISSALNAHGYNNGISNGSSTPVPQEENMNDLPLPPPPSPTQLQQYEMYSNNNINNNSNDSQHTRTLSSSLSSMSTGSNTTHSSTQSLSPTPHNYHLNNTVVQQQQQQQLQHQQHQSQQHQVAYIQPQSESTNSSLPFYPYGSTSPLHSRQASSTTCGPNYTCNNDNYSTITTIPPPPPPPLPQDNNHDLYLNTMKQQHNVNNAKLLMTKQNEHDMNTYNKTNVPQFTPSPTTHAQGVGGGTVVVPTTQRVYNKFLKEYSNKLLTQGNSNNNSNNENNQNNSTNLNNLKHTDTVNNIHSFINNGTPKPFITSSSSQSKQTQQQHNHYLQQQQQQQQQQTNNNNINNSLPSVAAITATLNNQLKFDSCQVAPSQPTATTPSSSNLSIADKRPLNNNTNSNSQIINDINNTSTNDMSSTVAAAPSADKPFEYVTLTGNVIRSVVPPGKGNVNYKVNQGGYARPYGAAPKSPVSYPPQQQQQQWNQPPPTQPKPAVGNAYATLPRSNASGQQGRKTQSMYNSYHNNYSSNYNTSTQYNRKSPSVVGSNRYSTMPSSLNTTSYNNYCNTRSYEYNQEDTEESLQPQYAECYFEEDYEVVEANREQRSTFCWPPPEDDSRRAPTAAPLYIAPPETQHVLAKPLENPPPAQQRNGTGCAQCNCNGESEQQEHQQQQMPQQQPPQWQSRSAPQLTVGMTQHQQECESGSDSYTSTSTTTTTTSEGYHRMYASQAQAYQMQQAYEQSGSELDYHMDMEVARVDQQDRLQLSSSQYCESGRRSAQECIETLVTPLSTYKLVDMVREVTPSPVPEPSPNSRHVVFLEDPDIKEVIYHEEQHQHEHQGNEAVEKEQTNITETLELSCEEVTEKSGFVKDDRSHILESQRIFQPTPEINIEIAPVRHIPPTKIPNPCPKEWVNPMVRVLTTASEIPFHMVGCLCPKPCECSCQLDPESKISKEVLEKPTKKSEVERNERPCSGTPEPEPVNINSIWDKQSISKAMTIAPEFQLKFAPPASEGIPLPEEAEPYMPPPIDIKPYVREDYRPKTPLLRALTTAPDKPFEGHFDRDVPIHILDLPTPKEHLTMKDALRTAPERPYTPLDPENATHMFEEQQKEEQKKKLEFQVLDKEEELGLSKVALDQVEYYTTEKRKSSTSAFAAMQAFQPSAQPVSSSTTPRHSISYTKDENDLDYRKYYDAQQRYQKRRSYFSQKEQELLQKQQTNTISQVQEQHCTLQQQQNNTHKESSLYSSTKASSSSSNPSSAVHNQQQQQQTISSTYPSSLTHDTKAYKSIAYASTGSAATSAKIDVHEIVEEVTDELEHSEVIFPPPSPLSHLKPRPPSGLHRPESIPKYQRNWTVLPTQSPVRTPEPPELRENVPLAFVDTPKVPATSNGFDGNTVHKPVAQISSRLAPQQEAQYLQHQTTASASSSSAMNCKSEQKQQQMSTTVISSSKTACNSIKQQQQLNKSIIPIIVEDRSGPVSMAFQSLDEHMVRDQSQTPSRPYTPSMMNKPAPITPYYQTPEKLCFDECPATHARNYDRRSASPFPDRARSPAPGPPPNPLAAIRAPRLKETEASTLSTRTLQAGSITTGQSYLGAQQAQQQERVLSHTATGSQSAMQSYIEQPEKKEKMQIGNMTMERSEKASRLEEQKQRQLQSHTTTQVGNTQIERRRKITEEFEHTSSAKTIEIRTGSQSSSSERRQSYGKTGFVANQAKRLSGLEEEISNLTSQSQAITARAATMSDTKFPEVQSASNAPIFPTKPVLPSHKEPHPANYYVCGAATKNLSKPISTIFSPTQREKPVNTCGTSLFSMQHSEEQQQKQEQQQKSLTALSTTSCSHQNQQLQANSVGCSLTKASATTCTNNQAYQSIIAGSNLNATSTSATTSSVTGIAPALGVCPVTGTFCRPGHTCCKQKVIEKTNNNGSRPNASLGSAGFKPPQVTNIIANAQTQPQSQPQPQPQLQSTAAAAAPAPAATKTSNITAPFKDNNNNNDSAAGGMAPKGGAYSATSAPKRGRGILNNAVSPGVRVPMCNSCGTNIRGPFITALGKIWCPEHFHCVNGNCRRPLQDIGFVEEKGDLYCEYCFEKYLAPTCSKCAGKIKGDCLNAIGKHFHPECFACGHCGKLFGNTPFFLEDGMPYCEADWNELFTTKCFACGFPVEAGDRWVEALNHNYHSQCFNCTYCKQNLEGQSFYNKGGRPFCKNHAR